MKITFFMQLSWNKVTFIATVIGISFFVSEKTRNVYCCSHYFLSVCIHKVAFFFKRQKTWKKKKNTWIINAKSLSNLFYYWNLPCDTFIIHFFVEIVYLFMGIIYAILSAFNFGVLFCIFHQIYLFFLLDPLLKSNTLIFAYINKQTNRNPIKNNFLKFYLRMVW